MVELLLRFLGGGPDDAVDIARAQLSLRGDLSAGLLVVLCVGMAAFVWWLYRRSPVQMASSRRWLLIGLRVGFLAVLLLVLARPVLEMTIEGTIRRALLLLVDTSASMQIKDQRLDAQDQQRAALAQGMPVENAPQLARIDLVKAALHNPDLNLLPRLSRAFEVQPFTFGPTALALSQTNSTEQPHAQRNAPLADTSWVGSLAATNRVTALGDALRDLVRRKRGQAMAGVMVITDGANNSGIAPAEAAAALKAEGLPLYVYGVGVRSPRDLAVANVFAPEVSFVDDEIHASVRLRAQGLRGQEATVTLNLANEVVASRTVRLGEGEEVVPLTFTPRHPGAHELVATIEPRPDEAVRDNNTRAQRLRVIDARIKVLLVDQSPRWEFRYLQAMLLRDRRVELKCFLAEADPAVAHVEGSPYLAQFPGAREEMFKYDVVILGDLDPRVLSLHQIEMLSRLVADFGGGLVMVAGRRAAPHAYRGTSLERLLPVELEALALPTGDALSPKPTRLELTAAGRKSALLRLEEQEDENARVWRELPPVFWVARTPRAKPAAEVLLADTDPARETRHGKMPVVALQTYGLGQVMYVGTDNTWRWRKNVGDQYYTRFWGQVVQRLAWHRLLGGSKRTQLATDRQNYHVGDRIPIYARLYSVGFEPINAPSVTGAYAVMGQPERTPLALRAVPEQPGLYRGEFVAAAAGAYRVSVEQDPDTALEFSVVEPQFELGDSAMNEPLLRELARQTDGLFFREEDLRKMPDQIRQRAQPVQSLVELQLWSSPACFLLLLAFIGTEWLLRKRWHLK